MTTHTGTAVRITVADHTADITSNNSAVTDWVRRYFGSWWHATPRPQNSTPAPVQVTALVDNDQAGHLAAEVDRAGPETVQYARKPMHLLRDPDGTVRAHDGQVVYRVTSTGEISIVGRDAGQVASAASRLAREALRGRLAAAGWVLLHASAAVNPSGHAWVAFGNKAAGKTTTALHLATAPGWSLLANDRLFARLTPSDQLEALPWPAAAAIGLGLLDATGWYDTVAAAHHRLHPSTPPEIHDALTAGVRHPIHDNSRELKTQLFPDQFTTLLGIPLATHATITTTLLPTVNIHTATPSSEPGGRTLNPEHDTFHTHIEDRYPPIWGLHRDETPHTQNKTFAQLNKLPRWTLTLTHNTHTNNTTITTLINTSKVEESPVNGASSDAH